MAVDSWWPADDAFEIMVGAVLTQNTSWTNVEKAIQQLKQHELLSAEAMLASDVALLAEVIRPSGYYNVKTKRLLVLCDWYLQQGGEVVLATWPMAKLRAGLLEVNGVGPETADDIVLYAFHHPVFVIDAYTRRIFSRLGLLNEKAPYAELQSQFEQAIPADVKTYAHYHALIIEFGKETCKTKPRCQACCLRDRCELAQVS